MDSARNFARIRSGLKLIALTLTRIELMTDTRHVFCRKYQQQLEGLATAPFPGAEGEAIFQQVSKQAWQEWLAHQVKLINEKHLRLMDPATQIYLQQQRELFFNNGELDVISGYVPPDAKK
jgi:hypothetical protein